MKIPILNVVALVVAIGWVATILSSSGQVSPAIGDRSRGEHGTGATVVTALPNGQQPASYTGLAGRKHNVEPSSLDSEWPRSVRPEPAEANRESRLVSASFQQDVDHFSPDQRAMSPRSWGNYHQAPGNEPKLPEVSFDPPATNRIIRPGTIESEYPDRNRFEQVESSHVRTPREFYETRPLDLQPDAERQRSPSSPIPGRQDPTENETPGERSSGPKLESRLESRSPDDGGIRPLPDVPDVPDVYPLVPMDDDRPVDHYPPKYNPALGHRDPYPTVRGFQSSSAEKFSYEEDMQFPQMAEILANSIFFSEVDFMFLQPSFQGNTAMTVAQSGSGSSLPFNFDLEPAFRVMAGYESDYGPGFAGEYFQFDNNSDQVSFTSDGVARGETRVYQLGPNTWSALVVDDVGETLRARHSLEVHSTSVYAFKALTFKRASVNGRFGIQLVSVDQKLEAHLTDATGAVVGRLNNFSNLNAFGPRFGVDYVRRIGHTPMQLITSATTSLLFGDRDQLVENTYDNTVSRIGADEFLTVIDIFMGVQGKKYRGEKRNTTFRLGIVNQTWLGGGTAIDSSGDFGFQGVSMMLGFNR